MRDYEKGFMANAYIFSLLLTVQLYFWIFTRDVVSGDSAPGIALFIVSLPAIIITFRRLLKNKNERKGAKNE